MQRRQRESLADILIIWGFVLTLVGLMGAGFYEACKIVAVIPAAFESSPSLRQIPMWGGDEDNRPNQTGRGRMTPRERAQERQRAEQQGR
jgi:hypothetical protein